MADECLCDIVTGAAQAGDAQFPTLGTLLAATALAAEVLASTLGAGLADTALAADSLEERATFVIVDGAIAVDNQTQTALGTLTLVERARAGELILAISGDTVADTAAAGEQLDGQARAAVSDAGQAAEAVLGSSRASLLLEDRARAADALLLAAGDQAEVAAQAAELLSGGARVSALAVDAATAGEQALDVAAAGDLLADRAQAVEAVMQATAGRQVVEDWLHAEEELTAAESLVWTCSTRSFGMSRLELPALSGAAVSDGQLWLAGDAGLYAQTDGPAAAFVRTGLSDFGSPAIKRATCTYVGYSGEPLTLAVGNTGSGAEVTYSYPLPARPAEAAVPARAVLGRGARSRYWRFTLSGTQFQLHDVELVIETTSRKV